MVAVRTCELAEATSYDIRDRTERRPQGDAKGFLARCDEAPESAGFGARFISNAPDAQPGMKVRLIRLQKRSDLNGVEGILGARGSDSRWQFTHGARSISIKAENFELVAKSKNTLYAEFMDSAEKFEYHNEVVSSHVFDQIWRRANDDGGIEGLFDTIFADEQQFDNIYQAFVQR